MLDDCKDTITGNMYLTQEEHWTLEHFIAG